ncbi:MAG: M6 family metalloprotease domain-containing protein [Bacteroidales bacterium]|nr:M6 family metalloprotease domain-containing protein [Bacteroidales bacterium]
MKKIFTLLFVFNIFFVSYGIYLENVPTQLTQPNGEVLNLFITGDEFYRIVHDSDGYSIVPGNDGWYYYAIYDADTDKLIPSEYIVSAIRTVELPIQKGVTISHKKYMEIRRTYYEPTGCNASGASKTSILKNLAANNIKTTQQVNNIVICIGFADTEEMTNDFLTVDGMFNSDEENNMKDYFSTMSYGKIDVISHFFPPADGSILRFYKDIYPRSYYEGMESDPYVEHALLARAVNWVNANWPIPEEIDLDIDNNGECDFITFVVYGPVGEWAVLLWPHKWSLYTDYVTINGKRVFDYNFELDGTPNYFSPGTFCHEGFHVFGAPDLYHYNWDYRDIKAVGLWDIMDQSSKSKPQSMSAYMKYAYGMWIPTLPITTINKTYEVYPFYTNDGSDPNKPIIHRVPMSFGEYCVVEYRKKTGMNYDSNLPDEGLMIYRIDPYSWGNAQFDGYWNLDEVYLFRPESHPEQGGAVYTNGIIENAPYNLSNNRTEFHKTTDPYPFYTTGNTDNSLNINNILYDEVSDSYTFFHGDQGTRYISLDKTELLLSFSSGSTGTLKVTSNVLWYINIPPTAANWLTVSKTKGLNTETVTFATLSENTTGEPKTAVVTFTGNGETFNVTVIQEKKSNTMITVNVSADPPAGGSVTGGGEYYQGDIVNISAIANENYDFVYWRNNESVIISPHAFYSFQAIENIDLVALFIYKDGIDDIEKIADFKIYPKPAGDILNVVRQTTGNAKIEIYNNIGMLVKSIEFNDIEITINLFALTSGVYFIKLTDNQNSSIQRFIKE